MSLISLSYSLFPAISTGALCILELVAKLLKLLCGPAAREATVMAAGDQTAPATRGSAARCEIGNREMVLMPPLTADMIELVRSLAFGEQFYLVPEVNWNGSWEVPWWPLKNTKWGTALEWRGTANPVTTEVRERPGRPELIGILSSFSPLSSRGFGETVKIVVTM